MSAIAELSTHLANEFPHVDSALLAALLLDYPYPTEQDELAIREMLRMLSLDVELEIGLSFGFDRLPSDSPLPAPAPSPPPEEGFTATLPTQDEVERLFASWTLEESSSSSDRWDGSTLDSSTQPSLDGHDPPTDYDPKAATDPISFLASVFPKLPRSLLQSRLDQNAGDLETLVEILLNEEFIATAEEATTFVGEPDFDYDDYGLENGIVPLAKLDHLSTGGGARKAQRKKEKSYAKASQVLNLTDVLHRSASPVPSSITTPATTFSPLDSNRWVTLDSTAGYLATLLHLPPGRVTSAYHRFDSSLPLAIESLLDTLELERPFDQIPDHERLLSELSTVLPDSSLAGLKRLLCATEGDSSDAMDLKLKLEEIFREEGSVLMNGLVGFGAGGDSRRVVVVHEGSTLESALETKRVVPSKEGWTKISPKKPLSSNSSSNRSSSNTSSRNTSVASSSLHPTAGLSSTDCAYHANDYLTKRNDAFRSAARAFQAGGTQRGVAWYYAEAGRELDRKKRAWEQRAAFAVVGERRVHNVNTIDLHGLTVHHALSVTKAACNSWWSTSSTGQTSLRIITGIGRHSVNNNPVIMPAVVKLLDREGWKWKWDGIGAGANGRGAISVYGAL